MSKISIKNRFIDTIIEANPDDYYDFTAIQKNPNDALQLTGIMTGTALVGIAAISLLSTIAIKATEGTALSMCAAILIPATLVVSVSVVSEFVYGEHGYKSADFSLRNLPEHAFDSFFNTLFNEHVFDSFRLTGDVIESLFYEFYNSHTS